MTQPVQTDGFKVYRVPCLSDNYAWLIHEPKENKVRFSLVRPSARAGFLRPISGHSSVENP